MQKLEQQLQSVAKHAEHTAAEAAAQLEKQQASAAADRQSLQVSFLATAMYQTWLRMLDSA